MESDEDSETWLVAQEEKEVIIKVKSAVRVTGLSRWHVQSLPSPLLFFLFFSFFVVVVPLGRYPLVQLVSRFTGAV